MKQSLKFMLILFCFSIVILGSVVLALYNSTSNVIPFTEEDLQFTYATKVIMLLAALATFLLSLSYAHTEKGLKKTLLYMSHCQTKTIYIEVLKTDDLAVLYDRILTYLRTYEPDLYQSYNLNPLSSKDYFVLVNKTFKRDLLIEFYLQ